MPMQTMVTIIPMPTYPMVTMSSLMEDPVSMPTSPQIRNAAKRDIQCQFRPKELVLNIVLFRQHFQVVFLTQVAHHHSVEYNGQFQANLPHLPAFIVNAKSIYLLMCGTSQHKCMLNLSKNWTFQNKQPSVYDPQYLLASSPHVPVQLSALPSHGGRHHSRESHQHGPGPDQSKVCL